MTKRNLIGKLYEEKQIIYHAGSTKNHSHILYANSASEEPYKKKLSEIKSLNGVTWQNMLLVDNSYNVNKYEWSIVGYDYISRSEFLNLLFQTHSLISLFALYELGNGMGLGIKAMRDIPLEEDHELCCLYAGVVMGPKSFEVDDSTISYEGTESDLAQISNNTPFICLKNWGSFFTHAYSPDYLQYFWLAPEVQGKIAVPNFKFVNKTLRLDDEVFPITIVRQIGKVQKHSPLCIDYGPQFGDAMCLQGKNGLALFDTQGGLIEQKFYLAPIRLKFQLENSQSFYIWISGIVRKQILDSTSPTSELRVEDIGPFLFIASYLHLKTAMQGLRSETTAMRYYGKYQLLPSESKLSVASNFFTPANSKLKSNLLSYAESSEITLDQFTALLAKLQKKDSDAINCADSNGHTALHLAVKSNQIDKTLALIDAGADQNKVDNQSKTPFELATPECRKILLEKLKTVSHPDILKNLY